MKETNISQLVDFIRAKSYATYNEIDAACKNINPSWRSESWRRALRGRKDIEAKHIENNPVKAIIGFNYKPIISKPEYECDFRDTLVNHNGSTQDALFEVKRKMYD